MNNVSICLNKSVVAILDFQNGGCKSRIFHIIFIFSELIY